MRRLIEFVQWKSVVFKVGVSINMKITKYTGLTFTAFSRPKSLFPYGSPYTVKISQLVDNRTRCRGTIL